MIEQCNCADCEEREHPCHCDCDPGDDECHGCKEAREDARDREFQFRVSQGII
jgi:hypothetical protein